MRKNRIFRKKTSESFGGSERFRIFATSNHRGGAEAAGVISSLFCVPTSYNNHLTTPSPEPGNRPGVSAFMDLTARSVVSFCQNNKGYDYEEFLCERAQVGMAVGGVPGSGTSQRTEEEAAAVAQGAVAGDDPALRHGGRGSVYAPRGRDGPRRGGADSTCVLRGGADCIALGCSPSESINKGFILQRKGKRLC